MSWLIVAIGSVLKWVWVNVRGGRLALLACLAALLQACVPSAFSAGDYPPFSAWPMLSPSSRLVYAGLHDGRIVGWSLDGKGEVEFSLQAGQGEVDAIAQFDDGTLVTGGEDGSVRFWRGEELAGHVDLGLGEIGDFALGPGGRLAVATRGWLSILSESGVEDHVVMEPFGTTVSAWSPNGEAVALGAWGGAVSVVALGSKRVDWIYGRMGDPGHIGHVSALEWIDGGSVLVSSASGGRVIVWDWGPDLEVRCTYQFEGGANGVMYSPDQELLVATGSKGKAVVLDLDCAVQRETTFVVPAGMGANDVYGVLAPGGESVYLIDYNTAGLYKWEFTAGARPVRMKGWRGGGCCPKLNADGDRLIVNYFLDYPRVWNPQTGEVLFRLRP